MQETITNGFLNLPKTKYQSYMRQLDTLLAKLRENRMAAEQTYKEIDRLRKVNDRSFEKMKRAVEKLNK